MKLRRPLRKSPAPKPAPAKANLDQPGRLAMTAPEGATASALKIFDISVTLLVEHAYNPNEQSEKTFDELVERIRRDGFDDPIKVAPQYVKGKRTGKFLIIGGHHRVKAAKTLGILKVPAVIREGWDEDRIAIELLADNSLTGKLNPHKFTELFDRLSKRYDKEQIKQMVGLTEKKAFDALYKRVSDQLPAKAKAKLDQAKERVNSVEDLSSVLNEIFRDQGSEVDHSFMILSFGGKKHTYIQIDANTQKRLEALKADADSRSIEMGALIGTMIGDTVYVDNKLKALASKKHGDTAKA